MDVDTAAVVSQVRLALRRLLGTRLQLAAEQKQATPQQQAAPKNGDRRTEPKRSEARASSG